MSSAARKSAGIAVGLALASCSGSAGDRASSQAVAASQPAAPQALYGVDAAQRLLIRIDPATAAVTAIGPIGLPVGTVGADFACDGTLWAFSFVGGQTMDLYTVDPASGAGTIARSFDVPGLATGSGFEFGPDETTPFWRNGTGLFALDVAAGTVHQVGTSAGSGVSLTLPVSCDQFLTSDCSGGACFLARIDPASGAVTRLGSTGGIAFTSLAAAPDGSLYGHSGGKLYRIDPGSGASEEIGVLGEGETTFQPVGMAYGPRGICCLPLDCSRASPTAATLWPPNHAFVAMGVQGVADPAGGPVEVTITGVRQDEPVNGRGDGNTAPDAVVAGDAVQLRAERSGGGDGRVYHVAFSASNGRGGACQGSVAVCVPHDMGQGATCTDQGPLYDSTAP